MACSDDEFSFIQQYLYYGQFVWLQRSRKRHAKLRGMDFWATGNEPPWKLEFNNEGFVLRTGYEQTVHAFPGALPVVNVETRKARYTSSNAQSVIETLIEGESSSDSMSGQRFNTRVTVQLDDSELRGCGRALH